MAVGASSLWPELNKMIDTGSQVVRLALLEDEGESRSFLASKLGELGFSCVEFGESKELLAYLRRETVDLLILDWNLGGISGLDVLKWMAEFLDSVPPTIMLTVRDGPEDTVAALEAGADDFVVKPANIDTLVARIKAVLRRRQPVSAEEGSETYRDYVFQNASDVVILRGVPIELTSKEFLLAQTLFRNMGRAISRAYLLENVWGYRGSVQSRTLDAHISKIRGKLDLRARNGMRLSPVYGYGYRLEVLAEVREE